MKNSVLTYLEETVKKYPDKVAICDDKTEITFLELRKRAFCIASEINTRCGVKKAPVMVYLQKSVNSIVAFMGVLYSGNFYTPTDVEFPFEKVRGIISQLNPSLYVTDSKYKEKLLQNGIDERYVINIDELECTADSYDLSILEQIIDTDITYTLFTSGSTGVPKGVAITNRSIIDYIDWAKECYSVEEKDNIGNQAPFYFDNSTLDIYLMLSTGATLYIIPKTFFSFPAKLLSYVVERKINMIFWVPSVLINIANYDLLDSIECSCLDKILFAGEVMPNKQLNYWRKKIPNALYSNLYGPTEITVDCTYYIVDREFEDDEPLPIGIPCRNSDILVLDEKNELVCESNKIGELCVRGSSLAVGYWNNIEKTNEVFVQNPLQSNYPEKIYRTGDLVYYNDRKELIFSGRKDYQIKHNGYRIELGEIENAALGREEITNVCCLYNQQQKKIVLLYQGDVSERELRGYLLKIIPKYMVPTIYYQLSEFPYNDNGKIDRKRLNTQYIDTAL